MGNTISANNTEATVSISISSKLLTKVDRRVRSLDLNRSQYFRKLAKLDIAASKADLVPVDLATPMEAR